MVEVSAAVEYHLLHALLFGALGERAPHVARAGHIAPGLARLAFAVLDGARRHQGYATHVVNYLGINVVERPVDIQPWTLGGTQHLLADAPVHSLPCLVSRSLRNHRISLTQNAECRVSKLLGSRLSNLLLQPLAGVAYALVLVGIGRPQAAHVG